ncbi:hypothetical protein GCM10022243_48880 [Saccharothrix violaceirubra]|uniref:Uncharacterized protein n=1 Tax=Saccharothrix violaceirubra TaxID=413306 RepID=A0A7W7WU10_9PSEU|nr:hypothetical protein [Saccharothrix violaceirubra]MBB4963770.1 hypothetical protein [Saccharothrix violaceirubra]
MSPVVPAGTVVDTTDDPRWQPLVVTATLTEPVVGLDSQPLCLDGPLAWCAAQLALADEAGLPPLRHDWAPDLALPLATWTAAPSRPDTDSRLRAADGERVWGWACSAASWTALGHTTVEIRRRPPVGEMARFTADGKHHSGLGPYKARDTPMAATWVDTVVWHALGDPDAVAGLLAHLGHLGRATRHGHGRIQTITVEPGRDRDAWRSRPLPDPTGPAGSIRAPYHHHSRRMPCRTP